MAASISSDKGETKISQKMNIPCIRPNQRRKTGSGKSLTYDCIDASPEQLVGDKKWRDTIKSEVYQRRLRAIKIANVFQFKYQ